MSIVAVKHYGNSIVIAGDSQLTRGNIRVDIQGFKKLVKIRGMIVGSSGDVEEAQLLQKFVREYRKPKATQNDILIYFATFFKKRDEINNKLSKEGELSENKVIICVGGKCFMVSSTLVYEVKPKTYDAIGIEFDSAIYLMDAGLTPEATVNIICGRSIFCRQPIVKYTMEAK